MHRAAVEAILSSGRASPRCVINTGSPEATAMLALAMVPQSYLHYAAEIARFSGEYNNQVDHLGGFKPDALAIHLARKKTLPPASQTLSNQGVTLAKLDAKHTVFDPANRPLWACMATMNNKFNLREEVMTARE